MATEKKSIVLEYLNALAKLYAGHEYGEGYYKWVLENGKLFTEKEDAKKFRKSFRKRFKGCYYNAQVMAVDNRELKYYEGWGVTEAVGIPLEHGFNVVGEKVVDISWADGKEYFGIEVPVDFVMREMVSEETAHPVLFLFWKNQENKNKRRKHGKT